MVVVIVHCPVTFGSIEEECDTVVYGRVRSLIIAQDIGIGFRTRTFGGLVGERHYYVLAAFRLAPFVIVLILEYDSELLDLLAIGQTIEILGNHGEIIQIGIVGRTHPFVPVLGSPTVVMFPIGITRAFSSDYAGIHVHV